MRANRFPVAYLTLRWTPVAVDRSISSNRRACGCGWGLGIGYDHWTGTRQFLKHISTMHLLPSKQCLHCCNLRAQPIRLQGYSASVFLGSANAAGRYQ